MKLEHRTHGAAPYRIVVVHGGPGAAGSMGPVARALADRWGVLEPFQTGMSVGEQVDELRQAVQQLAEIPVTLVGHSWGAWLSYLVSARHPDLVRKLVLVGSGGFRAEHGEGPDRTRLERLTPEERDEAARLRARLKSASEAERTRAFARFGELFALADAYEWVSHDPEPIEHRPDVFLTVWPEAAALRASGELLALGRAIRCPVVAIHGDHDSHPAAGVRDPLPEVLRDFRFVLLERCGHEPWYEKHARDAFFERLRAEIDPQDRRRIGSRPVLQGAP